MTARPDSTRTTVVDDTHEWRRMSECPPHRKCLLRNAGGMPVIGTWDGRDQRPHVQSVCTAHDVFFGTLCERTVLQPAH